MDSREELKEEQSELEGQAKEPAEKETQKDQPKVEQTKTKTTSETVAHPPVKKGGSNVAVIIIVIIVVLAVLGVGGYFGVRYLLKKFSNKITSITTGQTVTPASGQISVKTVEDALMYPGAKISDQEHDQNSPYKSRLILQSSDAVKTIYDYYVRLAATNKYTISTQGTRDENNYYLTLTDGVFTAEIDTTRYEGYDTNEIVVKISGDSLTSDSISISPTTSSIAKTITPTTSSIVSTSGNYVISDSSTRIITESELTGLTPWKLKVARNEIYARHGRDFVHKDLQCYFAKKSWYAVNSSYTEGSLSSTENKNVATIQAYENETNSPLASSDSGCDTNQ